HNIIMLRCQFVKIFAREVGFEWRGALALGMGGIFGGKSLEERGGMVRNVLVLSIAALPCK
ncbi:unnamed protein product, partial [marine sediment metagenome]